MTSGSGGIGGLPASAPAECQPDAGDCAITHSATGWCLASTGQPVILLIRVSCEPDGEITVTTVDASTGNTIPNGPVIPCGDKDWEVNQLCDVDPISSVVIATVTQIFEWDETTGAVTIRLERPDAPGVPYVPQGVLQTCSSGQLQAITTVVCGNTAGSLRQLTEVVLVDTLDGTIRTVYYLDGGALTALNPGEDVRAGDCWTPTLPPILEELEETHADAEACCATTNANLTNLISEVDQVEEILTSIDGHVDGLEGLVTQTNVHLHDHIEPILTDIESNTASSSGSLISILAGIGALQTCCAQTNANLVTIAGYLDAVEGQLNTIIGHVDGIEGILTTMTGQLTTIIGHVDGIETLIGTTNTLLTTANNLATSVNNSLTTIIGHVDGIEGLITTGNASLASILARLTTSALLPPGQITVGAVAVQMHPAGQATQKGVIVQSHPNNTGILYVGVAGVTTGTGFPLAPGASVTLPIPNTNQVYLIASAAGQIAAWIEV